MEEKQKSLIPNSTQIPNVILDLIMPRLPTADHERILRYICRRTFGFGKKTDRIGLSQFVSGIKTKDGIQLDYGSGVKRGTARSCLRDLIAAGIVQKVTAENGRANGYRINYAIDPEQAIRECGESYKAQSAKRRERGRQNRLFDPVGNSRHTPCRQLPTPPLSAIADTTKESNKTKLTKERCAAEPQEKEKQAKEAEAQKQKTHKPHAEFIRFWSETCQRSRGLKPIITGMDARNLKRVLDMEILSQYQLEQLAVYFLAHPTFRKFSPSIATFLSAGILNGLINHMQNRPKFWKELDGYAIRYMRPAMPEGERAELMAKLEAMRKGISRPLTPAT